METGVEVDFPYDRLPKHLQGMDGQPRALPEGEGPGGALTEEQLADYANWALGHNNYIGVEMAMEAAVYQGLDLSSEAFHDIYVWMDREAAARTLHSLNPRIDLETARNMPLREVKTEVMAERQKEDNLMQEEARDEVKEENFPPRSVKQQGKGRWGRVAKLRGVKAELAVDAQKAMDAAILLEKKRRVIQENLERQRARQATQCQPCDWNPDERKLGPAKRPNPLW